MSRVKIAVNTRLPMFVKFLTGNKSLFFCVYVRAARKVCFKIAKRLRDIQICQVPYKDSVVGTVSIDRSV